jgi:hypothetical protein
MATSGTVAQTVILVKDMIERSVRRCGRLPGSLETEDLYTAKANLFLILSALANRGIPLWTIEKIVLGLNQLQNLVVFPVGTIDLNTVLYRYNVLPSGGIAYSSAGGVASNAFDQNLATACTQTAPNGNISYNFNQDVTIPTVGFLPNATGTLSPVYEWSNDNVNWTEIAQASYGGGSTGTFGSGTYNAGMWYWQDILQPVSAQYWRLRETGGGTLNMTEIVFGQPANEITVARSNQDDYQNLPNKNIVTGNQRPLQYWFDRQLTPQAWLWPPSGYSFNTLICWARRQIQDVGSFTNQLEIPDRWQDCITWMLAEALSYELQGIQANRIPVIASKSAQAQQLAWSEERDRSPVYYAVNLTAYTRGR